MSSLSSPRCWGRHLGMLGKTLGDVGEDRTLGKTLKAVWGGHQGGRGQLQKFHLEQQRGCWGRQFNLSSLRYLLQWGTSWSSFREVMSSRGCRGHHESFNLFPEVHAAVGEDGDQLGKMSWGRGVTRLQFVARRYLLHVRHRGQGRHSGTTGMSGKASICCLRYLLQWGMTGTLGKTDTVGGRSGKTSGKGRLQFVA